MRTSPVTRTVVIALALVLGGLLTACGSSSKTGTAATDAAPSSGNTSSGNTSSGNTSSGNTSSSSGAGAKPLVTTKTNNTLGTILADDSGLTLYTLTQDGKPVACSGTCAAVWPPLDLPAGVTSPTGAKGATDLTAVAGPDGKQLVAAGGLPLYRFVKDKDPGDAYGEGIQSFGGTWHIVRATGSSGGTATTTKPATPTTATTGY